MSFKDTIAKIPFEAKTKDGAGFLPPMYRAGIHIMYTLACHADPKVEVTDAEAVEALRQAQEHWNARQDTPAVTTATKDKAGLIGLAIGEAIKEYPKWSKEDKTNNLRDLSHRIAQQTADLDRELVGIRDSDPGSQM